MTTPIQFIDLTPIVLEAGPGQNADGYKKASEFLSRWHAGTESGPAIIEGEEVTVAQVGRCSATVQLALTAKGIWLSGSHYESPLCSYRGGPSIWARKGYRTREDAIRAEAEFCAKAFAGEATSTSSLSTDSLRRACARMADMLVSIAHPTQTALFDTARPVPLPSAAPPAQLPSPPATKSAPIQLSLF